VSLREYNEKSQTSYFARDARVHFQMHLTLDIEKSSLISFIIKTQNIVRKNAYLRHEDRGCAVGLINAGTPIQKIRIIFYLYYFIIFNNLFAETGRLYTHHNLAHFLLA